MNCSTLLLLLFLGQTYCASLGNSLEVNITGVKRITNKTRQSPVSAIAGCTNIPIVLDGAILAGRNYWLLGHDLQQLACNGGFTDNFAEMKIIRSLGLGSLIVNPGCKVFFFETGDFKGEMKEFREGIYPNPKQGGVIYTCVDGVRPCVASQVWTCIQTYPSCTPSDSWQTITQLDNSDSAVAIKFTYEKTVGTEYSEEMKKSMSVHDEVTAAITAVFRDITATIGDKSTTGYDWSNTDTATKKKSETMSVEIILPAEAKLWIQEAQGTCGKSTIHTQMFRVINKKTGKMAMAIENKKLGKIIVL